MNDAYTADMHNYKITFLQVVSYYCLFLAVTIYVVFTKPLYTRSVCTTLQFLCTIIITVHTPHNILYILFYHQL